MQVWKKVIVQLAFNIPAAFYELVINNYVKKTWVTKKHLDSAHGRNFKKL